MHPETEAIKLLQELGINKIPINPLKIIENLKIPTMENNFKSIEGFSIFDPHGDKSCIGINSNIRDLGRKKFTYAHELGHFCLDAFLNENTKSCQKNDISYRSKGLDPIEINANIFASHLLLPEFLIKDKIRNLDPDWKKISELSQITETSLITMTNRFIEITEYSCLLVVISQDKRIKYFKKSKNCSLYLDMDSRILSSASYAYKSCDIKSIPDDFECVPANIWLSDKRILPDAKILEWSLPLNSYGEVLTLLWDDEDLLDQYENEGKRVLYNNNKIGGVWDPPTFHKSKRKS